MLKYIHYYITVPIEYLKHIRRKFLQAAKMGFSEEKNDIRPKHLKRSLERARLILLSAIFGGFPFERSPPTKILTT